jgi:hypothetical protein
MFLTARWQHQLETRFLWQMLSLKNCDLADGSQEAGLFRNWSLPANVHFYSREWTYLGSKKVKNGFQDLISDITGITAVILDGLSSVEELSVAQRMQWASGRHTTRSEDLAYCLMGIFGVNMPLLYGEGMKSFARLQEEILKGMWVCKLYTYIPFSLDFAFG